MADVGTKVVEKVVENLVDRILNLILDPITVRITVVRKCNDNVEKLKNQVEELKNKRKSVERCIEDVGRKGKEIGDEVQSWLIKADKFIEGAEESMRVGGELAKECFFRLCPNPLVRYKLSKKVAQITEDIAKHVLEARGFDLPLFPPPPPQEDVTAVVDGFEEFPSRMAVLEQIMEALKNPIVNTVGVHGTSGVGKTMLVKMVKRKAKQDGLFTAVVMATVTKDWDLKSIQEDIARDLGMDLLSFRELTGRQVADLIKEKLKNVKKFLVILDDVWETEIDFFEKVGIPSASELKQAMEKKNEGSLPGQEDMLRKILITSRFHDVLSGMMGEKDQVFEVLKLHDDEGWHLFKKIVGSNVESSDFRPTAKEIVEKCLGLPVAIASVGNAMKRKTRRHEWQTALVDLRRPAPEGIAAPVYKPIELSYKCLRGDELKQTFMLCSLLGHGSSINNLLKYGMGLNLFRNVKTIEETRAKVLTLVQSLKQSSLLVDGHSDMHFGMHDQIREIALSIAARYHGVLALVDEDVGKEWPEKETMKKLKWIYLSNGYPELTSNRLKCPRLTLFHLSNKGCSLPASNLFTGTEGLKVLCLTKIDFQSLPLQIPLIPTKLHTLILDQCVFTIKELGSIVRNLESLEVLSLAGCDIEECPREIEKLSKLKLLDVSDCTKLKVVPQQVLARLSKLEELKMGNSFDRWDDVEEGNARLAELTELHKLTALEVRISNFQEALLPENLERFKIFIGIVEEADWEDYHMYGYRWSRYRWSRYVWNSYSWESSFESSKIMKIKLQGASIKSNDSIKKLLKKTEELYLEGLNGVENLVYELNDEGFQHLKCLQVQYAPDITHIFNLAGSLVPSHVFPVLEVLTLLNLEKMKKICDGLTGAATFKKLRKITVVGCHQLKNLFSYSMARQLQLEKIKVEDCNNIEQIIDDVEEQGNGHDIVEESEGCKLGNTLRSLKLGILPKLIGFNSNCSDISLFNDKIVFPNLEKLYLDGIKRNQLWTTSSRVENPQEILNFKRLTSLQISNCSSSEYLFTPSMVSGLGQLKDLDVAFCDDLKQVIMAEGVEEAVNTELIFPQLNSISLEFCDKLSSFYAGSGRYALKFQSATKISIVYCKNMITFVSTFSTEKEKETAYQKTDQGHLQKNEPNICSQTLFDDMVVNPVLDNLFLQGICVQQIWPNQITPMSSFVQKLRKLTVCYCDNLKYLFTSSMVKIFEQLEVLQISYCEEMQEVILIEEPIEKERTSQTMFSKADSTERHDFAESGNTDVKDGIMFSQLKSLKLVNLPKLSSYSTGKCDLEFPSLKEVIVTGCPRMKYFSMGKTVTKELQAVQLTYHDKKGHWVGDLNSTIQDLFTLKVSYLESGNLWLSKFPELIEIWKKNPEELSSLFQNLRHLKVCNCNNLSYLLTPTMKLAFVQLEGLEIKDCAAMEQVIMVTGVEEVVETGLTFLRLKEITVKNCPKMVRFTSKFSSIQEKGTIDGKSEQMLVKEEPDIFIGPFFCDEVEIPLLDDLSLGSICAQQIWHSQITPMSSFVQKLRKLTLWDCNNLKYLFTSLMVKIFEQLEVLEIRECKEMQVVILIEEQIEKERTSQTMFPKPNSTERHDFAKSGNTDVKDGIMFSQLKSLKLVNLPKLSSYSTGKCDLEFPSLKEVIVTGCPQMKYFSMGRTVTKELQNVQWKYYDEKGHWVGDLNSTIQDLFTQKVGCLEDGNLWLSKFPELIEIWKMNPENLSLLSQNLHHLKVCNCNNLSYLLTPNMALAFVQLEDLEIKDCAAMEQVIMVTRFEDVVETGLTFPQLKSILLESCSKLSSFYVGSNALRFPLLEKITVKNCPKMVRFTSKFSSIQEKETTDGKSEEMLVKEELDIFIGPFFCDMVEFPKLELLKITSVNIHQIWPNEISKNSSSIQNLKELKELVVEGCGNLKYLLTSSMVESFEQLTELQIYDCKMMEIVILTEESGKEERMSEIFFPKLHYLMLKELPILTRFCSGIFLELSSLANLQISKCSMLKTFISSSIIGDTENGVNADAPYLFDEKIKIPIWKTLTLSSINIRQIWNSQLSSISSFAQHLTKLKVVNCCNLKHLLTFSMVKSFAQLEELMISECEIMEVVILIEGMAEEERICQLVFPQLKTLVLNNLPQLATFCSNCDSLGEISEPERVNFGIGSQELVATESTSMETKATKVVFSPVTWLTLRLLPKFNYFFPQTHITEWPLLERLVVMECHEVQIVASKFSSIEMAHGDNQLERESQPLMFWISKATFPSLKHLTVNWNDNLKIWCGHHPEEYFGLEVLTLIGFPKQSAFPPPFFFESLPNLKELVVKDAFLSEIFQCEEVTAKEKPVYGHTSLSKLTVSKLHELTHLWKEESQLEADILNNLRFLKVQECSRLKNLVPSTVHFDNLRTLLVSECHGLVNLMRYSTAKSLGQLETMKVANCEMIEEIVICLGDAVEDDGIVFTNLKYLQLKGLPKLESFCSGNCNFKFPALVGAIVTECPNMQIFSKGELCTPRPCKVKLTGDIYKDKYKYLYRDMDEDIEKKIDDMFHEDEGVGDKDDEVKDESCWEDNLNSTIQHLFKEKSARNSKRSNGGNSDHDAKEDEFLNKILKTAFGTYFEKDIVNSVEDG